MEVTEAPREAKDVLFRRIGVDLPLSEEGSGPFAGTDAPVRGLAVSNRFGICFVAHSGGFVVTQTSSLVDVAQQAKNDPDGKTAQQGSYLNVPVSGVRILCLSKDELTLAACVGDRTVHLYDVPTLVHKLDRTPLESRDIPEGCVKDFRWSPADDEIYVLLSREGQLFSGHVGEPPLRVVNNNVVGVSWSPDGKHVAHVTNERAVCVSSSKFEAQYNFKLPAEIGDFTDNLEVESLQWVRPDAMLVAYTQINEDEEEEECPLILVTSRGGDLSKEGGTISAVYFDSAFPSIDSRNLPAGSGPYMLAEYIQPWEMAIAASRRSVDDHFVLLGWFSGERKHEAFSIEIPNDVWLPRIELQENGDDNILLGLAVGMTTTDLQVTDPRDGSGDTNLPACPVLMCLSLGGKLSLFSMARLDESTAAASLVSPPLKLPERNRAEVKPKTSMDMVTKTPQAAPSEKETSGLQPARDKQAEEKITYEPLLSSGSETDREDDGSHNDEVLPRFPELSPLERGSQTGPQKLSASGARTLAVPSARQSGVSEPEQAFIVELEKIKKMADEVDNLMAYIEGRGQKTASNQPPCFTKQSLNELELGIRTLADNCKTVKERVEEERQSLNNLRDENLQVDAWRLYVQSLAEQAAENRHQELWSRRKLTPDLDVKRKRVTKSEQALKQQIAALEEHVHHLELDNRKRVVSLKGGKNNLNRQTSTGRSQSVQNLYSTVNGLLASADRLSQQVAQQMETLNISAQPHIAQKILKSVGLPSEDVLHVQSRPSFSGTAASPLARQQSIHSPSFKTESGLAIHSTPPRRTMPSDSGVGAPSITRRRRDSMDGVQKALALAGGASPKTTIERLSHHTPSQQPNLSSTSSNIFVKHVRQRSSQESSERSSSHPRHVRRVLSSQTRSATSSPGSSTSSSSEHKTHSGFSANSTVASLQGSLSSTVFEQQSRDSRPDSKRAASRNASSFAEKSGPPLASRFGPLPGRTTSAPTTAASTSSSAAVSSQFGPSQSNAPSESVFKFANNNLPKAASSFSFATPSGAIPTGAFDSSGSMPFGKAASNLGTTQSSSAGVTTSLSSFPNSGFGSAGSNALAGSMSTAKLGIESTLSGVNSNLKSSAESGKDEKPAFGFKAASFGTPSFGTPSFSSSSFSRSSLNGSTQAATAPSLTSFTLNVPANKPSESREGDAATKQNDTKQTVPLTSAPTQNIWTDQKSKATGTTEISFSTGVSQTVPTAPSSVAPPAAKPAPFGAQVTTPITASTNLMESQSQGGQQSSLVNVPASSPIPQPSASPMGSMLFAPISTSNAAPSASSQTSFVFPAVSAPAATFTAPPITTPDADEEDMDEEQVTGGTTSLGGFNLGGLGLGGSSPAPSQAPKTNIFGSPAPFGTQQTSSAFGAQQSSSAFGSQPTPSAFGTSSPQGQLFRPPSFSLPSAQSPPQTSGGFGFGTPTPAQTGASPFGSAFGGATTNPPSSNPFGTTPAGPSPAFGSPAQPGAGGFGQPSQLGPGQQALGSALGAFGQTRQMGFGSTSPFGSTPSAGFGSVPSGGGFASAPTGGGFANAATGGGFASAATGGGFASAATGGGFAGAATGGGFAGAAGASGGGFAGAAGGGGFQAFGGNPSGGFGGAGQSPFGTTSPPAQSLFTQMRK